MIIEVKPVNEHIMRLRIRHSLSVISMVSVYAPTKASDLTVKDTFSAMLESVVDQCPRRDTLRVLGISMHQRELKVMVMRRVFVPMGLEL